jgi:glyoxylase-like metal-dependent hydrolase (beta-lactamase superfamily II)
MKSNTISKPWNVMAFQCGTFERDSAAFTGVLNPGEKRRFIFWCTALWNNEHRILVDTGLNQDHRHPAYTPIPNFVDDNQCIHKRIKEHLGWETDDVDIVINTHLHYDHCGHNRLFRNAKFYVQKTEWEATQYPNPKYAVIYFPENYDKRAVSYLDWVFVDGEADVVPGIRLIPTPGHTLGHQSVLVNTEEGILCVTGDAINCLDVLRFDLATGATMSNIKQHETNQLIAGAADFVLPGHECGPELHDLQTKNFPCADFK